MRSVRAVALFTLVVLAACGGQPPAGSVREDDDHWETVSDLRFTYGEALEEEPELDEPPRSVAPSVDPETLPEHVRVLATLAADLTDEGVQWIVRTTLIDRHPDELFIVEATIGMDALGTFVCLESLAGTRCFDVATRALTGTVESTLRRREGRLWVHASLRCEGDETVLLEVPVDAGEPRSVRREDARSMVVDLPGPALSARDYPASFSDFTDLEIASDGGASIARMSEWIAACRIGPPTACTAPIALAVLDAGDVRLAELSVGPGDLWKLEVELGRDDGVVVESARPSLFLLVRPSEIALGGVMHERFERRAPVDPDRDDVDGLVVRHATAMRSSRCVSVETPEVRRWRQLSNGRTRTLRAPRLARAPDSIPPGGVDAPRETDLRGSWEIRPGEGLVRVASCPGDHVP